MSARPSAAPLPAVDFVPMRTDDLTDVARVEAANYDFPWTRGNFADSLTAGHSAWVARIDDAVIGHAVLLRVLDEAHLLNLTVDHAWRGRGVGRAFLVHLIEVAREWRMTQLLLEVRPSNSVAQNLYADFGFRSVGRRRNYYPAKDGREDAIVMVMPL